MYTQNSKHPLQTDIHCGDENKDVIAQDVCNSLITVVADFVDSQSDLFSSETDQRKNSGNEEIRETINNNGRSRRAKAGVIHYSCDKCNIQFLSPSAYSAHTDLHSMSRPFGCDVCERRYKSRAIMERHKKMVHSVIDEKCFKCKLCGRKFLNTYQFEKHEILCEFNNSMKKKNEWNGAAAINSQGLF